MNIPAHELPALLAELERRIAEPAPLSVVPCLHCQKAFGFHVQGCPQDSSWLRAWRSAPIPTVIKEPV